MAFDIHSRAESPPSARRAEHRDRVRPSPELAALLAAQDYVVSREQLLTGGRSRHAIANAFERHGWQHLLPSVYLTHPGEPSRRQLLVAGLLYAGEGSAIDADDACVFHGVKAVCSGEGVVRVVVPADSPARTHDWVRIRRTAVPFAAIATRRLRYVEPAVAVVAAGRLRRSDRMVLALASDAVQRRITTHRQLLRAHIQGPPRNAGPMDRALAHIAAGVASAAEADFRALAESSTVLPPLLYNRSLRLPDGRIVVTDALAADAALVHETNGRIAHLRDDRYEDMQERHDALTVAGLTVLHNTPRRIGSEGRLVIAQFERIYLRDRGRGLPPGVELLPSAG